MDLKLLKKLQNEKTLVLLSKHNRNLISNIESVIGKIFIIDDSDSKEICSEIVNIINNSSIENIIFVNFNEFFRELIPNISIKIKVKWLITHPVASFTDPNINAIFINMMEFHDRFLVKSILCIEKGLYEVLKKKGYKSELINLNIKTNQDNCYNSNLSIGILSNDYDPKHGFYNMLTALKLTQYKEVKLISNMKSTLHFLDFFDIKYKLCDDVLSVIKNNTVNLYCNFTNSNNSLVLKSLDMGIPCIIGNSDLFDNNPLLKKYLVLKRDDDVNELSQKIDNAIKNYDIIIREYKGYRLNN